MYVFLLWATFHDRFDFDYLYGIYKTHDLAMKVLVNRQKEYDANKIEFHIQKRKVLDIDI